RAPEKRRAEAPVQPEAPPHREAEAADEEIPPRPPRAPVLQKVHRPERAQLEAREKLAASSAAGDRERRAERVEEPQAHASVDEAGGLRLVMEPAAQREPELDL